MSTRKLPAEGSADAYSRAEVALGAAVERLSALVRQRYGAAPPADRHRAGSLTLEMIDLERRLNDLMDGFRFLDGLE